MEKFSSFRDPGTGIQPFLTPLPPAGSDPAATVLLSLGYALGVLRTLFIAVLACIYAALVHGLLVILTPIPSLHRYATSILTTVIARLVLLLAGLWWIPVEVVSRKRTKGSQSAKTWSPKAGDIIVSNWASWIEILWLAFRFNPAFVVPVVRSTTPSTSIPNSSVPITHTPGRRTGTGSVAIASPTARSPTPQIDIIGFQSLSLVSILRHAGCLPLVSTSQNSLATLEEIRAKAHRPVVVFPECTTSNGRGLLRFAEVFRGYQVPLKNFQLFIMCVRYDPPTVYSPSLTHSIPSSILNPFPHILQLTSSPVSYNISIRLLSPAEGPSSGSFLLSDYLTQEVADPLSEVCAALISQIGKMKRVGLGWEDKVAFGELYQRKK